MSEARDYQVAGEHYTNKKIQPWDAMEAWMPESEFNGFLWGNAIKYLARWPEKGGRSDLLKCKHYIDKLLERV